MKTAAQIRREFIQFFATRHGHEIVPSSPVVPHGDPTLLFTNAGMNQFKDVFLGRGKRSFNRAVDSQKCIRAGGKHNDLEDVGKDTYHHTFFEMLGNWSFGDYFKEEAIAWAWDLLTGVWGLEKDRIHVTVFEGDSEDGLEADVEAERIWRKFVDPSRIRRFGRRDNFWEMGETGPCGPCSEIHFDQTPDRSGAALVNTGDPRVIEIWNLVFIQFDRGPAAPGSGKPGALTPLPAKHVDTGMGFERIVRVLQKKSSNYDTDLWMPIFAAIEGHAGAQPYRGRLEDAVDIAYRVIADHVRCLTVAISDGAEPSNEGRGYVLRRILRRAVRHAHQTLGVRGPVLYQIVPSVIESIGDAFPDLAPRADHAAEVIRREEEAFLRTIDRGIEHFRDAAVRAGNGKSIAAADAFKLHDTYGFPIDLTRVMADEQGLSVDEAGFETLMDQARVRSRAKVDPGQDFTLPPHAMARLKHLQIAPTNDIDKYHGRPIAGEVRAIWNGGDFDNVARPGRTMAVIADRTNFYAEQGGQIGDMGEIRVEGGRGAVHVGDVHGSPAHAGAVFEVKDTRICGGYVLHIGEVHSGAIRVADRVTLAPDSERREPTRANHTATHLLNHALRQVLGDQVQQKGSLVEPDRLRFDFAFSRALTPQEINAVERLVNAAIHQGMPVHSMDVPLADAMKFNGVRAVFGEKYPDPVRVISIGPSIDRLRAQPDLERWRECSIEFCGGTHLSNTREAKRFVILSEGAVSAGVRRINALTGTAAMAAEAATVDLDARTFRAQSLEAKPLLEEAADIARSIDELAIGLVARQRLTSRLAVIQDRVKQARKESMANVRDMVVDQARVLAESIQGRIIVDRLLGADSDGLLAAGDVFKSRRPEAACMLFSGDEIESKVSILAIVPKELVAKGLKAGDWVKTIAPICGGGGGGRPDMAQAGGKYPERIGEAIERAKSYAEGLLR